MSYFIVKHALLTSEIIPRTPKDKKVYNIENIMGYYLKNLSLPVFLFLIFLYKYFLTQRTKIVLQVNIRSWQ